MDFNQPSLELEVEDSGEMKGFLNRGQHYFNRKWLYPPQKMSSASFTAHIQTDPSNHWGMAELMITDGAKIVWIDLEHDDPDAYQESLQTLNILIDGLLELKNKLSEHHSLLQEGKDIP